jgi:uncharacterized MAPEG superfamily protein
MNWTYFSLLIAGILPVACAGIAKLGFKHYDNHNPRAWLANQTGFRTRANAAQSNSFEAFPFFAVGVLLALLAGVDHGKIDALSIGFVVARMGYIAFPCLEHRLRLHHCALRLRNAGFVK